MARVFIVNKSHHDFEKAKPYGELIFLSEGPMNRFALNDITRQFSAILEDSHPDDWILLSGLTVMNVIASSLFSAKHKRLNLLLYSKGTYIERNLVL